MCRSCWRWSWDQYPLYPWFKVDLIWIQSILAPCLLWFRMFLWPITQYHRMAKLKRTVLILTYISGVRETSLSIIWQETKSRCILSNASDLFPSPLKAIRIQLCGLYLYLILLTSQRPTSEYHNKSFCLFNNRQWRSNLTYEALGGTNYILYTTTAPSFQLFSCGTILIHCI